MRWRCTRCAFAPPVTDFDGAYVRCSLLILEGRPHSRRERGPLQFVFLMDEEPELGGQSFEKNWVWMAERIEPAE